MNVPKEQYNNDPSPIEELVTLFQEETHLRIPTNGKLQSHWLDPLVEIYKASGKDFDTTKERVRTAIGILKEKGYTISSPSSIQNTAVNLPIYAKQEAATPLSGKMVQNELGEWLYMVTTS